MRKTDRLLIGVAVLAVACLACLGARPNEEPTGLFAGLEVGQGAGVKDLGTAYEITVLGEGLPAGYQITVVGPDYLGVRDHAGVTERRIPITSIKSVARMRIGVGPKPSSLSNSQP